MSGGFIAVHVGAGHHSTVKSPAYKQLCRAACEEGIKFIGQGAPILDAVVKTVRVLEDSPLTNAGFGSSVTESGNVECDASVMEGTTQRYGAVGSVSRLRNPIELAQQLLVQQLHNKLLSHGRIPPAFLVGRGAEDWAVHQGLKMVNPHELIDERILHLYRRWKKKLTICQQRRLEDICCLKEYDDDDEEAREENCWRLSELVDWRSEVNDTVGAIGVHVDGQTAAAVSSGGLMMKQPGRVGPAAVFGSGCWARDFVVDEVNSVAAATSGCGESLIRTIFARECCKTVEKKDKSNDPILSLQRLYTNTILKSNLLSNPAERLAGSLLLTYDKADRRGEVFWTHTTDSMCVGFMSSADKKSSVRMSRLPLQVTAGNSVVVEGSSFDLRK